MDNQFEDQMMWLAEQIAGYEEKLKEMDEARLSEEFNRILNVWAEEWLEDSELGDDFGDEDIGDDDFGDEDVWDDDSWDVDSDDDSDDDLDSDSIEEITMEFMKGLMEESPQLANEALKHVADMIKIDEVISVTQKLNPSWNPAEAAEDKDAYEMYLEEKRWMEGEE
ncbi:MAG: hypothetical protein LUE87_04020 [Lachnospiraceae bacterium]|nr:hypothetical protein [Lachnospiraceae bacterium]